MPLRWRFTVLGDRHRALGSKLEDWSGMGTAWTYDKDIYHEHIQDGGKFPKGALDELGLTEGHMGERKAGMLPNIILAVGAAVVLLANWFFQLPT